MKKKQKRAEDNDSVLFDSFSRISRLFLKVMGSSIKNITEIINKATEEYLFFIDKNISIKKQKELLESQLIEQKSDYKDVNDRISQLSTLILTYSAFILVFIGIFFNIEKIYIGNPIVFVFYVFIGMALVLLFTIIWFLASGLASKPWIDKIFTTNSREEKIEEKLPDFTEEQEFLWVLYVRNETYHTENSTGLFNYYYARFVFFGYAITLAIAGILSILISVI